MPNQLGIIGAGRIGQQSGESRLRRERERGTPRLLARHSIGPAVGQRSVEELQRLAQCDCDSRMGQRCVEFGAPDAHGAGGDGAPAEQAGERAAFVA